MLRSIPTAAPTASCLYLYLPQGVTLGRSETVSQIGPTRGWRKKMEAFPIARFWPSKRGFYFPKRNEQQVAGMKYVLHNRLPMACMLPSFNVRALLLHRSSLPLKKGRTIWRSPNSTEAVLAPVFQDGFVRGIGMK